MTGRVDGKIALISGAGTGVGRACMVLFGREGDFSQRLVNWFPRGEIG